MNQPFHLYRLQQIDTQIDQVNARIAEFDRLLAGDEDIRQAQHIVDEKAAILKKARQALKQAEFAVREQALKIEQSEATLYGGKVRNPKELQDLQKEVASLKKYLSELEDRQLEAMIAVEEAEGEDQQAQAALLQAQASFAEQSAGWLGQRDQLMKTIDRLQAERGAALALVEPLSLQLYNRMRQRKNGVAVTIAHEGSCALCGTNIRPAELQDARAAKDFVYCSNCGRILYAG